MKTEDEAEERRGDARGWRKLDIDKTVDYRREEGYKKDLKRIVLDAVEGTACRVFLFGSRVTNRIKRSSDFDIGVMGLDAKSFGAVKRAIEEIEVWKDARIT